MIVDGCSIARFIVVLVDGNTYSHELFELLPFHARSELALFRGIESRES
jgi:hypothetical protein